MSKPKNILAIYDKCKGSLTSNEMCDLTEQIYTKHNVTKIPMTDGGDGFIDVLTRNKKNTKHSNCSVVNSINETIQSSFVIIENEKLNMETKKLLQLKSKGKIAVVEMAKICGIAELSEQNKNPWKTSTVGIGKILREINKTNVDLILLGVGGSSTNDIGVGALCGLGAKFLNQNSDIVEFPCPEKWSEITTIDLSNIVCLPRIVIASDVQNILLGKTGCTFTFALQKGCAKSDLVKLESNVVDMVNLFKTIFNDANTKAEIPCVGSAGGIGYALSLCYDVQFISGFELFEKWFDIESTIKNSDVVFTGEGKFDETSLYGKGPYRVIELCKKFSKKLYIVAGSVCSKAQQIVHSNYKNCEFLEFGNPNDSLKQNIKNANSNFKKTLTNNNL